MKKFLVVMVLLVLTGCSKLTSPDYPIIRSFTSDSSRIGVTQTTTLRWEVLGNDVNVRIDPLVGNVSQTGSHIFVPLSVGTVVFTLTASNNSGDTQRVLTVVVQ